MPTYRFDFSFRTLGWGAGLLLQQQQRKGSAKGQTIDDIVGKTLYKTSSTVCDEAVELSFWSDNSIQSRDTYGY